MMTRTSRELHSFYCARGGGGQFVQSVDQASFDAYDSNTLHRKQKTAEATYRA